MPSLVVARGSLEEGTVIVVTDNSIPCSGCAVELARQRKDLAVTGRSKMAEKEERRRVLSLRSHCMRDSEGERNLPGSPMPHSDSDFCRDDDSLRYCDCEDVTQKQLYLRHPNMLCTLPSYSKPQLDFAKATCSVENRIFLRAVD